jgi:CheY-like chemotaxis protein
VQSILNLSRAPHAARLRRPPPRVAPRVLFVDDCPLQRLLGLALLSRWEITPELASDGREAILLAGDHDFDIILMDLDMPVVDGFAATESIRQQERTTERQRRVPVVAYTANYSASTEGHWFRSGMDAVLAKPSAAADMGECLRRWCPGSLVFDRLVGASAEACPNK